MNELLEISRKYQDILEGILIYEKLYCFSLDDIDRLSTNKINEKLISASLDTNDFLFSYHNFHIGNSSGCFLQCISESNSELIRYNVLFIYTKDIEEGRILVRNIDKECLQFTVDISGNTFNYEEVINDFREKLVWYRYEYRNSHFLPEDKKEREYILKVSNYKNRDNAKIREYILGVIIWDYIFEKYNIHLGIEKHKKEFNRIIDKSVEYFLQENKFCGRSGVVFVLIKVKMNQAVLIV